MDQYSGTPVLPGFILKGKARELLSGRYSTAIIANVLVILITLGCQFAAELIFGILFVFALIVREIVTNHLSIEQLLFLLEQTNFIASYQVWYDSISYVISFVAGIFTGVFNAGLYLFFLNMSCGRQYQISDIFYGFRHQFGKTLKLAVIFALLGELYSLPANIFLYLANAKASQIALNYSMSALLIGCMIYLPISLSLSQAFLLLLDFPEYSAGKLLKLSSEIMQGHKCRLFLIQLSFLPLMLLSFLTFGVGLLWLAPYMNLTHTLFFLNLMQARDHHT